MKASAIAASARRALGRRYSPYGRCLQHNYEWAGSPASRGPGAGRYGIALACWTYASVKHPGDYNPPAGAWVIFGVSPTRHDALRGAGDVGTSLGDGTAVFTDATAGGIVGRMSIAARARQIQRPYLGWIEDVVGNPTEFDTRPSTASGQLVVINPTPKIIKESDMAYTIRDGSTDAILVVAQEQVRHILDPRSADTAGKVFSESDEIHQLNAEQTKHVFDNLGIPRRYLGSDGLAALDKEGAYWSRSLVIERKLDALSKR